MNLHLQEKVIIVTGAASGIGETIANSLAAEGCTVCIIDRNEKAMVRVAKEIAENGGTVFYTTTELTKAGDCHNAVEQILKKFGRIDGLVNNAGLNDGVGLENGSYEKFIASLDINAGHYFTMGDLVFSSLQQSRGTIVNICSKTAETGQGGTSGYAAANGARMALTTDWAAAWLPFGIRVNAVVVAECWTPQYEWWISQQPDPQEKLRQINAKIPLGNRMTTCEEIADMVLFLLSTKSTAINGQLVHVDGGYVHLDRSAGALVQSS